jgi:KipI family sensor histidine kinase inhibitor
MTRSEPTLRLLPASDRSLLIVLGDRIDRSTHRRVRALLRLLDETAPPGVVDLVPAYASVLLVFDPRSLDHARLEEHLARLLERLGDAPLPEPRLVTIPVVYGGVHGPDLEEVARHARLTPQEVMARHAGTVYDAYFLGFAPGFAYLGLLPPAIACPRLPQPRRRVPAGSVAIAGRQTAVYPCATPGGWRLIGRTPLRLFDPARVPRALVEIGDRVRFEPVAAAERRELEAAWASSS